MAFRYCRDCGAGMVKPTPREDLIDGQECKQCGVHAEQYMSEKEWIIDLWDQIEEMRDAKDENLSSLKYEDHFAKPMQDLVKRNDTF